MVSAPSADRAAGAAGPRGRAGALRARAQPEVASLLRWGLLWARRGPWGRERLLGAAAAVSLLCWAGEGPRGAPGRIPGAGLRVCVAGAWQRSVVWTREAHGGVRGAGASRCAGSRRRGTGVQRGARIRSLERERA